MKIRRLLCFALPPAGRSFDCGYLCSKSGPRLLGDSRILCGVMSHVTKQALLLGYVASPNICKGLHDTNRLPPVGIGIGNRIALRISKYVQAVAQSNRVWRCPSSEYA